MNILIVIQFFLTLICLAVFIACYVKLRKLEKLVLSDNVKPEEILDLKDSIEELNKEALKIAEDIGEKLEEYRTLDISKTGSARASEYKRISKTEKKSQAPNSKDEIYDSALQLVEGGVTVKEAAQRLKIPIGELELALEMRKKTDS